MAAKKALSKRKQDSEPSKAPQKKSRRTANAQKSDAKGSTSSKRAIAAVHFLLSDRAKELCTPPEELEQLDQMGSKQKSFKTYRSEDLTPFEELVSAMLLSRPINHRLGSRAIRTLLNEPYKFGTVKALKDAGHQRRWDALNEARTQHKDKTATQLGDMADSLESMGVGPNDTSLEAVRKKGNHKSAEIAKVMQSIKGMGATGTAILFRRLQRTWPELYPTGDDRALAAARNHFGIPARTAKELATFVSANWDDIKSAGSKKAGDKEAAMRATVVTILDRAVGIEIENNVDTALEEM